MQNFMMSQPFRRTMTAIAALIVLLIVFLSGITVGERHLRHRSFDRGQMRQIPAPPGAAFGIFPRPMPMHGAFGKVISINEQTFILHGKDNQEQTIETTPTTVFRGVRGQAAFQDVTTGTDVAVFGEPNEQDHVRARLIRILGPR